VRFIGRSPFQELDGIRAEWGKKYFAEIAYTNFSDSPRYSLVVDRDNVVMFAGVNF